jgi:hypothetical protein
MALHLETKELYELNDALYEVVCRMVHVGQTKN